MLAIDSQLVVKWVGGLGELMAFSIVFIAYLLSM